jgi:hypothetical protein
MANSHDYIIANDTGSAVRSDLNTLFLEIEASNAGDSAPSNVAAGKLWHDTTTDHLKYYTGAEWVSIARSVKGSANNTDITGTIDPAASTSVTGVSTVFTTEAKIGDKLVVTGETRTITAIASDTACTVDTAFSNNANDTTPEIHPAAFVVLDDSGGIDFLVDTDGNISTSDGAVDFDIVSHDGSNGLKLGGTLVTATAATLNSTVSTGKAIAMAMIFGS